MTDEKRNIIHQLLEEYDIQSAEYIQEALKDLFGVAEMGDEYLQLFNIFFIVNGIIIKFWKIKKLT